MVSLGLNRTVRVIPVSGRSCRPHPSAAVDRV